MKTNKRTSMMFIAVIAMFAASSCSVEYRARHPRPPRHRRVIVVGKGELENNKIESKNKTQTDIAVY